MIYMATYTYEYLYLEIVSGSPAGEVGGGGVIEAAAEA